MDSESNKRKPFLLYFNQRDTLTYKKEGGLLALRDTFAIIPFYWKGNISLIPKGYKSGTMYSIGPRHHYIQKEKNSKHKKQYLPKDSFKNYEIVKVPWKGFNIDILDLSHPDSAFIVTVDSDNRIE